MSDLIEECKKAWTLQNWKRFMRAVENYDNAKCKEVLDLRSSLAQAQKERDKLTAQLSEKDAMYERDMKRALDQAEKWKEIIRDREAQLIVADRDLEKLNIEHARRAGFFCGALGGIRMNLEHGEVDFVLKKIPELLASPEMVSLRPDGQGKLCECQTPAHYHVDQPGSLPDGGGRE